LDSAQSLIFVPQVPPEPGEPSDCTAPPIWRGDALQG
jgi:hypothetical protein